MNQLIKFLFLFILISSTSSVSFAEDKKNGTEDSVKPTMHQIFFHMQSLAPYMLDEAQFRDPKNEKKIQDHLTQMHTLAKNTEHFNVIKHSPALKISKDALIGHFAEIESVFAEGNKSYARWQLNATLPLCMNCHTQAPSKSKTWNLGTLDSALNDFQKAELLFMGRDFDDALKLYDKVINGFPGNKAMAAYVEKSFERKVVIYSRVRRNFEEGISSLEKNLKNKELPPFIVDNVKASIALFRIQQREGFPDPKKADDKKITQYIEKELKLGLWDDMVKASNPRLVKNLTVSGVLYEYLNLNPKTAIKPEILYWLSLCDRQLKESLFYSLADLYLKECMNEYTKHPMAKKCFEEYKVNTLLSYTGSAGTDLPSDVKKELDGLAIKIFGKKQKLELESGD